MMNSLRKEVCPRLNRRTGRRRGESSTREDIAAAAARLFAERGYDRRACARSRPKPASTQPSSPHYFGSKQRLFVDGRPAAHRARALVVAQVARRSAGRRGSTGSRHRHRPCSRRPAGRERATSIVRLAASEPEAAALLRSARRAAVRAGRRRARPATEPELPRERSCGRQMVGLVMARYVVGVEPLASAEPGPRRRGDRAGAPALPDGDLGVVLEVAPRRGPCRAARAARARSSRARAPSRA